MNTETQSTFIRRDGAPNYLWQPCEEIYFSFNPAPHAGISLFASDGGASETAMRYAGKFLILNGDWREEYQAAYAEGGIPACVAFYEASKAEHRSSWSEDDEEQQPSASAKS